MSIGVADLARSAASYDAALPPLGLRRCRDHNEYDESFYGAFVLDPDGYKIEAVRRDPG